MWNDCEPPCETCKHDVNNACVIGSTCAYVPKARPVTYHIKALGGEYIGRSLRGYCLVARYENASRFPTEEAACEVCTQELAERLKVFLTVCSSEEES